MVAGAVAAVMAVRTAPAARRWLPVAAALLGIPEASAASEALLHETQGSPDAEQDARASVLSHALAAPDKLEEWLEAHAQDARGGAHHALLRRAAVRARRGFAASAAARGWSSLWSCVASTT